MLTLNLLLTVCVNVTFLSVKLKTLEQPLSIQMPCQYSDAQSLRSIYIKYKGK